MSGIYLYYRFWLIFIFVFFIFFIVKYVIRFIRINGFKAIFISIFNKENRFILLSSCVFILIFCISFYCVYYIRVYPSIRITEEITTNIKTENYTNGCIVGNECKSINLNIKDSKTKKIDFVRYSRNYVVFKLNIPMYIKKCNNCVMDYLDANTEYKLELNNFVYLEEVNNSENKTVNYIIEIY